jgi:hypothetical protein
MFGIICRADFSIDLELQDEHGLIFVALAKQDWQAS